MKKSDKRPKDQSNSGLQLSLNKFVKRSNNDGLQPLWTTIGADGSPKSTSAQIGEEPSPAPALIQPAETLKPSGESHALNTNKSSSSFSSKEESIPRKRVLELSKSTTSTSPSIVEALRKPVQQKTELGEKSGQKRSLTIGHLLGPSAEDKKRSQSPSPVKEQFIPPASSPRQFQKLGSPKDHSVSDESLVVGWRSSPPFMRLQKLQDKNQPNAPEHSDQSPANLHPLLRTEAKKLFFSKNDISGDKSQSSDSQSTHSPSSSLQNPQNNLSSRKRPRSRGGDLVAFIESIAATIEHSNPTPDTVADAVGVKSTSVSHLGLSPQQSFPIQPNRSIFSPITFGKSPLTTSFMSEEATLSDPFDDLSSSSSQILLQPSPNNPKLKRRNPFAVSSSESNRRSRMTFDPPKFVLSPNESSVAETFDKEANAISNQQTLAAQKTFTNDSEQVTMLPYPIKSQTGTLDKPSGLPSLPFEDMNTTMLLDLPVLSPFDENAVLSDPAIHRSPQAKAESGTGSPTALNQTALNTKATVLSQDDLDALLANINVDMQMDAASSSVVSRPSYFERYLVLRIHNEPTQKVLDVRVRDGLPERHILLRDEWMHNSDVRIGDYVHVVGVFDHQTNCCIINTEMNLLITHPDHLISGTTIADSFPCARKPVLAALHRGLPDASPALVYGAMTHSLFERALRANDFSIESLQTDIEILIQSNTERLYGAKEDEDKARRALREHVQPIQLWAQQYITPQPTTGVNLEGPFRHAGQTHLVSVHKVLDIEENVWSPKFGIKGKIDASIEVQVHRRGITGADEQIIMPLELKTGKDTTAIAHRAQVSLYTLLMADRYDVDVQSGLIFYLKTGEVVRVPSTWSELSSLIMQRNRLANYFVRNELPQMTSSEYICKRCHQIDRCLVHHRLLEEGTAETSRLGTIFSEKTNHLTDLHAKFLQKWLRLLALEVNNVNSFRKQIWLMSSKQRESRGGCLGNMIVDSNLSADNTNSENNRLSFVYRFRRHPDLVEAPVSSPPRLSQSRQRPLGDGHLAIGDPIVVSTEAGHFGMAIGFIKDVSNQTITLTLDRELLGAPNNRSNDDNTHNFDGIWELLEASATFANSRVGRRSTKHTLFRIDKDELAAGLGQMRGNLLNLFTVNGDAKRRRIIVDQAAPQFLRPGELSSIESHLVSWDRLNKYQQSAVQKVLTALDYALIRGMPGTGKTTTIAYLIRALVSMGKTVLLTSYTHSAVDNILLKLVDEPPVNYLRLGNHDKIHPSVARHSQQVKANATVSELAALYESVPVVATTCLGVNHTLFQNRKFDYCILDEASQVTQPVSYGPLACADKFVLVGDEYQLPPLVRNADARRGGYDESLFAYLSNLHKRAVAVLHYQYRMNAEIMTLPNALIYGDRLRCGNQDVATARLSLPRLSDWRAIHEHSSSDTNCWLDYAIEPECPVVFLDTDEVPAPETKHGDIIRNEVEAEIVRETVNALVSAGMEEQHIGIISPYRAQLRLLRDKLNHRPAVEVLTIDRSQGREKRCIILSFVRSNPNKNAGDLLRDFRRVNVAVTRAEHKLILIGSKSTFDDSPCLQIITNICVKNKWITTLPKDAHRMHQSGRVLSQSAFFGSPSKSPLRRTTVLTPSPIHQQEDESNDSDVLAIEMGFPETATTTTNTPPKATANMSSLIGNLLDDLDFEFDEL